MLVLAKEEGSNRTIVAYDSDFVELWSTSVNRADSMCSDGDENVYVMDFSDKVIRVFDTDGNLIKIWTILSTQIPEIIKSDGENIYLVTQETNLKANIYKVPVDTEDGVLVDSSYVWFVKTFVGNDGASLFETFDTASCGNDTLNILFRYENDITEETTLSFLQINLETADVKVTYEELFDDSVTGNTGGWLGICSDKIGNTYFSFTIRNKVSSEEIISIYKVDSFGDIKLFKQYDFETSVIRAVFPTIAITPNGVLGTAFSVRKQETIVTPAHWNNIFGIDPSKGLEVRFDPLVSAFIFGNARLIITYNAPHPAAISPSPFFIEESTNTTTGDWSTIEIFDQRGKALYSETFNNLEDAFNGIFEGTFYVSGFGNVIEGNRILKVDSQGSTELLSIPTGTEVVGFISTSVLTPAQLSILGGYNGWPIPRPPTYDPFLDWDWVDGQWDVYPDVVVKGGGRYRNTMVVVGKDSNDKGIIYVSA